MPEQVKLSENSRYISIISTGKSDFAHFRAAVDDALALHEAHGVNVVLVDSRARDDIPPSSELSAGADFLAERTRAKLRFAVVINTPDARHEDFATDVGMNFGLVRFFTDEEEALRWLGVGADED